MLWVILSGGAALVVAAWIAFRISNRHVLRLCKAIPSAKPCYPLLGNILLFACPLDKMTKNVRQILEDSVLKGHRAICFWIGAYPLIFVTDPDDVKTVLNNSLSRGKEMEASSREYLQYGLITSPVDHWKVTRRHLNATFHPRNLQQLMPTFNSTSRRLVADLSRHVDGAVFNLMPHVMSTALSAILTFLYGPRTMEFVSTEHFNSLRHAVELAAELMALRVIKPWLSPRIVFNLLYGKEINSVKTAFGMNLQIANANSVEKEQLREEEGDSDAANGQHSFQTILDAMRDLQKRDTTLTDQHVADELSSFFAAGTDTIGASASSCLLVLARFPHMQDRVYEEVCSALSSPGDDNEQEDISHSDLKRLTYLDQVIKETLRFFTVVPFNPRAPDRDIDLGAYTVPANKTTFLCTSAACFDPRYFPDPYKFDPDRFSTPNSCLDDVFIPFGRGRRNCIGKTYSMMLIKVMIARVVRKYRLTTNTDVQNLKKKFTITLTCCDGYNVSLTKRSEWVK